MTNTTKYLLVGGAALVVGVVILRKMQAQQATATTPTGVAGVLSGMKNIATNLQGLSWGEASTSATARKLTVDDGIPYGPGASDGTAAISDATGVRTLRAIVPAQTAFLTDAQRALAGLH